MNNCLVYAHGEDEWQVMWHSQDNILSTPNPQFTFSDIPYDEYTGFIIESCNGLSRVLFYDLRPQPNVQTAVLDSDQEILYCNLMEFIPYPPTQAPFQTFALGLSISSEAYPVILDKWMQSAVQPAPAYVVLTQDDWISTHAQMHNWQVAQQLAAYEAYVAQQLAFFAAQRAEYEVAMRIEREREILHLQNMLERASITSPNSDLKYTGSVTDDTSLESRSLPSESLDLSPRPAMQFSKSAFKPTPATVKAPTIKQTAVKPPPPIDAEDVENFGTLLSSYPASMDKIYNFINMNLKFRTMPEIEKFFKQISMPFTICEGLVKRKPISDKVKRALLSKILTYTDEVYDDKVESAVSILNVANAVTRGSDLHSAIEKQFKEHLKRVGSAPKAKVQLVETAPVPAPSVATAKPKESKPKVKKLVEPKPSAQEQSDLLFALLNSGKKIKADELAKFEAVMGMVNALGQTPLMTAIQNKLSIHVISFIISCDNNGILLKDPQQRSALHYLVQYEAKEEVFRNVVEQFMIDVQKMPIPNVQQRIDYFKDNDGNTFLHMLIKGPYELKTKMQLLSAFCAAARIHKDNLCLLARDQDLNNLQALFEAEGRSCDEMQFKILNAISQLCIDSGFGRFGNPIPKDLVDYFNFTRANNTFDALIAANNFARLKEIIILRMYLRCAIEINADGNMQSVFKSHDLIDMIYALVAADTHESIAKAIELIKLSRDCELAFPKSKYFKSLDDDNILPQPNVLQQVLLDINDYKIEFDAGIKVINLILQINPEDSIKLVNEENFAWLSAIDYVLQIIDDSEQEPEANSLLGILSAHGLNIEQKNQFKQTALHRACEDSENPETIEAFLALVPPNMLTKMLTAKDYQGRTALQIAKENEKASIVDFLKDIGRKAISNRLAQ